MDRWGSEFCGEVLSHIPRATKKERAAFQRELQDHLEDAADALEAGGRSWEEARTQAVEAMGDPAEIGKALNAQLSPLWLWLGRVCKGAAICLLCLLALTLRSRRDGMRVLTSGGTQVPLPMEGYLCREASIQLKADMVKLRIYRTELSPDGRELVLDCAFWTTEPNRYDREELGAILETESPGGVWWDKLYGTGGKIGKETDYIRVIVPVKPGQATLRLRLRRFEKTEIEMPIDWGEWYETDLDP